MQCALGQNLTDKISLEYVVHEMRFNVATLRVYTMHTIKYLNILISKLIQKCH